VKPVNDIAELNGWMKYAYELKLEGKHDENALPTIGIVFANKQIPVICHKYLHDKYRAERLIVGIRIGEVTAQLFANDVAGGYPVFSAGLNYDAMEVENFKKNTPAPETAVLILGFQLACHYYLAANPAADGFSPILLREFHFL
jgi:hypothetical protein